jgi:lipopolysaccharide/colanic/teichoic acid biosynthesis glycosyltransferase
MTKRLFDIASSLLVLVIASPVIGAALLAVWLEDRRSPFYRAQRVGLNNRNFSMLKIRSMRVGADRSGVTSTSASDSRITRTGHLIRRYKIDELSQFWNVLKGDMSVVGPRPNTRRGGVDNYTQAEMRLLSVKPGITDLASIVFSDEGDILKDASNPDGEYDRLIRPWKSRLGLVYVANQSLRLDLEVIWLTALAILTKRAALDQLERLLERIGADPALRETSRRTAPLQPCAPPA